MTETPPDKLDTKTRIMNVAERLFAEKGIDATSLRTIIAEAEVNLAAVHYHFGSKDDLLRAVLQRIAGKVNDERLRRLDILEADHPLPDVEQLVEAFLAPVAEAAQQQPQRIQHLIRLVGQLQSDTGKFHELVGDLFADVAQRFTAALSTALPDLPKIELMWRFKFMLGTMHMLVAHPPMSKKLAAFNTPEMAVDEIFAIAVRFVAAGFCAPAAQEN